MIVVDSSAVAAILFGEGMAGPLVERLAASRERVMSVVNYVEVGTVLAGRRHTQRERALAELDAFLEEMGISLAAVDAAQARAAMRARVRFEKGMGHGGTLNFGDCFAYALAMALEAPLLFVGDDFVRTDVRVAMAG